MEENEARDRICRDFDAMLAERFPSARRDYLLEHPVLLSAAAIGLIQDSRSHTPEVEAALGFLEESRLHLWSHPEAYPLGHGPLERVVDALRVGTIGFDAAVDRARAPECSGQLSHTYLRAVMLGWVNELEADVRFATRAAEIGLESAWAMPFPQLALDVRRAAAEGFIRLVHGGLLRRPDGRIYERALEVAQWAIADAERAARVALKCEYLHAIGTLSLDAFAANVAPSKNYRREVAAWLANAVDPMPSAEEGLGMAVAFLRSSVEAAAPDAPSGQTLKALLEAEIYLALARGDDPDAKRVEALAAAALGRLDARTERPHVDRVLALNERFGS